MEKGIKKGHPLATKLVDEPSYKRPIHGFCYTHFNMNKELTLDYLNLTVAHLIDDIDTIRDYNNSFWHEEILSGQVERLSLTASLLGNLLDEFERGNQK
ncbi:hypothetical protein QMA51_05605 [Leuconostoc suionicum]|uniref:hypothetical protein n=1 Tax=Leuconostoc suionicum TaxID=1511761 RepID=UPI0024ADA1A1|nr:hypothetical protein [Leuconostoc suionicum]MDI6551128.1 hypothetical protein [Leuconostoc suionicum]